jgi:hypothetical protein
MKYSGAATKKVPLNRFEIVGSSARPKGARLTQLVALQGGGSPKYLRFYALEFYLVEYIWAIGKSTRLPDFCPRDFS